LSDSYFVDRQDRYVLIKDNEKLADYLTNLTDIVRDMSYSVKTDGTLSKDLDAPDPLIEPKKFETTSRFD